MKPGAWLKSWAKLLAFRCEVFIDAPYSLDQKVLFRNVLADHQDAADPIFIVIDWTIAIRPPHLFA